MHRRWLRYAGGEAQAAFEASVMARLEPGMKVLDAGCGTGALARRLLSSAPGPVDVTLIDNSAEMLALASSPAVQSRQGCLMDLPFADEQFDLVTAAWSIEATPNPARCLRELLRVLRPSGTLAMVFCSNRPTRRIAARLFRQSVLMRGTGAFLETDAIVQIARSAGAARVIRHNCGGPASAISISKASAWAAVGEAA